MWGHSLPALWALVASREYPSFVAVDGEDTNARKMRGFEYLSRVYAAGGFVEHLAGPRLELVKLRRLCLAGRASVRAPESELLVQLFGLAATARTRRRGQLRGRRKIPDEVFRHIVSFWWGGE